MVRVEQVRVRDDEEQLAASRALDSVTPRLRAASSRAGDAAVRPVERDDDLGCEADEVVAHAVAAGLQPMSATSPSSSAPSVRIFASSCTLVIGACPSGSVVDLQDRRRRAEHRAIWPMLACV
jgi:hypothetical protein